MEMMWDLKKGRISFPNGVTVGPGYTFEDFKKTPFYAGQDGVRVIYIEEEQEIDGRKYGVRFFFRKGKLYLLSLICADRKYTAETEPERKKLHDEILRAMGQEKDEKKYLWGEAASVYEGLGSVSDIEMVYNSGRFVWR